MQISPVDYNCNYTNKRLQQNNSQPSFQALYITEGSHQSKIIERLFDIPAFRANKDAYNKALAVLKERMNGIYSRFLDTKIGANNDDLYATITESQEPLKFGFKLQAGKGGPEENYHIDLNRLADPKEDPENYGRHIAERIEFALGETYRELVAKTPHIKSDVVAQDLFVRFREPQATT